tara:strand:+ start:2144 stop:2608 length:465 start_codon:yes stop_codon:yes gene_type:complete
MDKEIKQEIKRLTREGLGEQLAIITACANKGKPELASEYLEEMQEEQDDIKYALEKLGMVPLHEAYKIPLTVFDTSYNLIMPEQLNARSEPPRIVDISGEDCMTGITITYEDIEPEPEDKKADEALDKLEAEHEHIMKNGRMYKVQKEQPEYNI